MAHPITYDLRTLHQLESKVTLHNGNTVFPGFSPPVLTILGKEVNICKQCGKTLIENDFPQCSPMNLSCYVRKQPKYGVQEDENG